MHVSAFAFNRLASSASSDCTAAPAIPAHIAIAALLLMAPALVSGSLGSPVLMLMVFAHQPSAFHGYLSITVATYLMSSSRPPSLWRMYTAAAVYHPKAGGPPPAIASAPSPLS